MLSYTKSRSVYSYLHSFCGLFGGWFGGGGLLTLTSWLFGTSSSFLSSSGFSSSLVGFLSDLIELSFNLLSFLVLLIASFLLLVSLGNADNLILGALDSRFDGFGLGSLLLGGLSLIVCGFDSSFDLLQLVFLTSLLGSVLDGFLNLLDGSFSFLFIINFLLLLGNFPKGLMDSSGSLLVDDVFEILS